MEDNQTVNYALALKNYSRNGKGRSMKRFCEEEGYDYGKFLQYSRHGQKEYSVLKEADERQLESGRFIPLVGKYAFTFPHGLKRTPGYL